MSGASLWVVGGGRSIGRRRRGSDERGFPLGGRPGAAPLPDAGGGAMSLAPRVARPIVRREIPVLGAAR